MLAMRSVLGIVVFFQIAMSGFGAESMGFYPGTSLPTYGSVVALYIISPVLFALYVFTPLSRFHSAFRSVDEDDSLAGDTKNIHYNDVADLKGYEIEPYICPRITERIYRQSTMLAKAPF